MERPEDSGHPFKTADDHPNKRHRTTHAVDDKMCMRLAIDEAEKAATSNEVPVGCVVTRGGEIIGSGHNYTNKEHNATRHAELVAADNVLMHSGGRYKPGILSECDLYVTCEPCIMCADALSKLAVRRVVFGCYNGKFGGCGSILSVHKRRYSVTSGVMNAEAIKLFKAFYARENDRAPEAKRKHKDRPLSHARTHDMKSEIDTSGDAKKERSG